MAHILAQPLRSVKREIKFIFQWQKPSFYWGFRVFFCFSCGAAEIIFERNQLYKVGLGVNIEKNLFIWCLTLV